MERVVFRGDDYDFDPRYLYRLEIVAFGTDGAGNEIIVPMDLAGCRVLTTYKPAPTDPSADPDDADAPIRHEIVLDATGAVVRSQGLRLAGPASAGILIEDLPRAESLALPLGVPLLSDVQVTTAAGKDVTLLALGTLVARDGLTNRRGTP